VTRPCCRPQLFWRACRSQATDEVFGTRTSTTSTPTLSSTPLTHLPPATRAQTAAAPGNVLRTAAHLAADHGPFDLVLA
jgi:hypothetical protein